MVRLIPRSDVKLVQSWDSNCHPRSVMIVAETPKREIHPVMKAWATLSAVIEVIWMASSQRMY